MTITLSKGGTRERKVELSKLRIPDLWHIANAQEDSQARQAILDCWHIAHDLWRELAEREESAA